MPIDGETFEQLQRLFPFEDEEEIMETTEGKQKRCLYQPRRTTRSLHAKRPGKLLKVRLACSLESLRCPSDANRGEKGYINARNRFNVSWMTFFGLTQ